MSKGTHGKCGDQPAVMTPRRGPSLDRVTSREQLTAALFAAVDLPDPVRWFTENHHHPVMARLLPELRATRGYRQDTPYHPEDDLFEHHMNVLGRAVQAGAAPHLRVAAVLHDLGKPAARWTDENGVGHYYQHKTDDRVLGADHEQLGAEIAERTLRASAAVTPEDVQRVIDVIRLHMAPRFSTRSGARRFLRKTGVLADDLISFRGFDWENDPTERDEAITMMRTHLEWVRQDEAANAPH